MELIAVETAPPRVRAGAASVAGHRRSLNEDALVCGPTWFAVADGMGGPAGGEVASGLAIDLLSRRPAPNSLADLEATVDAINTSIRSAASHDDAAGMGSTLVAATPYAGGVALVHIGDSRCYRFVDGALTLLTHDHSHVQELVDAGLITPDEARHHRLRNVITRALGVDTSASPEVRFVSAPVGRLLLCSDGLTAELVPQTIGRVLAGIADPQDAADRLVELALRGAARDNVTAIVVDHLGATA